LATERQEALHDFHRRSAIDQFQQLGTWVKSFFRKINWLWMAGVVTLAYGVLVWSWVGRSRLTAFLADAELNSFGDFLAGVFSPLAFIWLVAAVLTQRQELDETREQFAENQKVVDAQMKTISSQNSLLALQHNQAQESAKQTYRLNLFDRRYEIFNKLGAIRQSILAYGITPTIVDELRKVSHESAFVFSVDIEKALADISEAAEDYQQHEISLMVPDGHGNLALSSSAEDAGARARLIATSEQVLDALDVSSLMDLMWSSMRVSDD
jgi:hypothetical protein